MTSTSFRFIGNFTVKNTYTEEVNPTKSTKQVSVVSVNVNFMTHPQFFTQKREVKKSKVKELKELVESLKTMTIPDILDIGALAIPLHNDGTGYYSTSGDVIIHSEPYTIEAGA